MLIDPAKSHLLVIDVQEKLAPIVEGREAVLKNAGILLKAAAAVGVPVTLSEQYPKGLGHTVPELAELVEAGSPLAKVEFSCARNAALGERLRGVGREQLVLGGIEAHICVLQTALDLVAQGRQVFVVADAVGSRVSGSKDIALRRMMAAGVQIVTTEMVVFEWLQSAEAPAFRELSRLIR